MDQTNSMGLWTHANEFYQASCILVQPENEGLLHPSYYLVSHSIELALKAFLRGNGVSLEDLKNQRKFGHDLEKVFNKCIQLGLESFLPITEKDKFAIITINDYYKTKELEYIVTGFKRYPKMELLTSFNARLLDSIRQFCFDKMNIHVARTDNMPLEPIR
jgi:hypothetical protein